MSNKISFLFKRIATLHYDRMFKRAKEVADKNHRSAFVILLDMIYSGLKYQAGYEDYVLFDFANLTAKQRSTYMTRGINNQIVHHFNQKEYRHILRNKIEFHKKFSAYTKRSWLDVSNSTFEDFQKWVKGKEDFIIKPPDEGCGNGVQKIVVSDYADLKEIYDYIIKSGSILAEDRIIQCDEMAALNPSSINTVRFVTIYDKESDTLNYPFISVRIGNGRVVDNINNGGMASIIDPETGTIKYPASDKNFFVYEKHPATGTQIAGFKIPYWEESLALVEKIVRELPEVGYVGWDIGMSKDGPVLLEGNDYPGHDIYQMPGMVPDKIGLRPVFQKMTKMKL